MAEEKKDEKREKKEPPTVSLSLTTGEVKNRQVSVTVFVSLGKRELSGSKVYFYIGYNYDPIAESLSGTDGRTAALINIPVDAKGSILVAAKAEGMTLPVYTTVDIPEEEKPSLQKVDYLDVEPTGLWHDEQGYSHMLWTPRAFDENKKAVKAVIKIVGARPFKIVELSEQEQKIFSAISIPDKEINTYEIIVSTSGLLEVDVFIEGVDLDKEFMLEGARPAKQPGFFMRRYLERRERRG